MTEKLYEHAKNKMDNMDDIRKLLNGVFYTAMQNLKNILLKGINDEKPNFTQLQLALQEIDAPNETYTVLRRIMEIRFKLERI